MHQTSQGLVVILLILKGIIDHSSSSSFSFLLNVYMWSVYYLYYLNP